MTRRVERCCNLAPSRLCQPLDVLTGQSERRLHSLQDPTGEGDGLRRVPPFHFANDASLPGDPRFKLPDVPLGLIERRFFAP